MISQNAVRTARWSFLAAAAYGLLATIPLYFQRPLSSGTVWLFGFAGAAAATQLLYLLIGLDPRRYCNAIPVGIVSKLSFAVPVLWMAHAAPPTPVPAIFGWIDLALAALFAVNYLRLRDG